MRGFRYVRAADAAVALHAAADAGRVPSSAAARR